MNTSTPTTYLMTCVAPDGAVIEYKSHKKSRYALLRRNRVKNTWYVSTTTNSANTVSAWIRLLPERDYSTVKLNKTGQI
jgi:hypothetical protein